MPIPVCGYVTCLVGRFPIDSKAWSCLRNSYNSLFKYTKCLQVQTAETADVYTLAQDPLWPATIERNVNAVRTGLDIMRRNIHVDDGLQIDLENDIQIGEMTTGGDVKKIL